MRSMGRWLGLAWIVGASSFVLSPHALCTPRAFCREQARTLCSSMTTGDDSAQQQQKPKTKQDRFELQFTCNVCETRNTHSISRHAYTQGTVIVTCPGCNATHLVADNLNWIEDDFRNLEEVRVRPEPSRRGQQVHPRPSAPSIPLT